MVPFRACFKTLSLYIPYAFKWILYNYNTFVVYIHIVLQVFLINVFIAIYTILYPTIILN